jgi:hypothetical protein
MLKQNTHQRKQGGLSARQLVCALPLLLAIACWVSPSEAFVPANLGRGFLGPSNLVSSTLGRSGALLEKARIGDARAKGMPSLITMMADRLKNAAKVGVKIPPGFSEGADFVRDGKNLKAGDLVLINR